jgi:hypothetical protein
VRLAHREPSAGFSQGFIGREGKEQPEPPRPPLYQQTDSGETTQDDSRLITW